MTIQKDHMKHRFTALVLTAAALSAGAGLSAAADTKAAASQPTASASKANTKAETSPSKSASAVQAKAPAAAKLVDINSATSKELKKLPGINDAKAAKIIAGRPYGSKAWLVSHDVIDAGEYETIKHLIVARQPYKDAASNAALYKDKK
jgi:DNA uptake protein ComE-like DNA-binding protein